MKWFSIIYLFISIRIREIYLHNTIIHLVMLMKNHKIIFKAITLKPYLMSKKYYDLEK